MGYGEFVGNMSVHWRVDHEAGRDMEIAASDDAPADGHRIHVKRRIQGRDPRRGDTFAVALRFDSPDQARQALQAAIEALPRNGRDVYVSLAVPALRRANGNAGPAPEVRVSW